MIVFKVVNEDVDVFEDAQGFADRLGAESLTNQISDVFKDDKCEAHPDLESVISVEFSNGAIDMQVKKYCCDAFNSKLIKITQNEKPF